jgi:pyruvate-ferredoxin/flavodoxin oxidoreductase
MDVTHTSLDYNPEFSTEAPGTVRALFYGWGAEAPSAPTRPREKIIGEETCDYA